MRALVLAAATVLIASAAAAQSAPAQGPRYNIEATGATCEAALATIDMEAATAKAKAQLKTDKIVVFSNCDKDAKTGQFLLAYSFRPK